MEGQTDPELTDCLRAAHGCAGLGKKERGRLRDLGSDGKKQGSRGHRVRGRKRREKPNITEPAKSGKRVGWVILWGHTNNAVEIVGVSSTITMYLKFDQQKSSRNECLILHLEKKSLVWSNGLSLYFAGEERENTHEGRHACKESWG